MVIDEELLLRRRRCRLFSGWILLYVIINGSTTTMYYSLRHNNLSYLPLGVLRSRRVKNQANRARNLGNNPRRSLSLSKQVLDSHSLMLVVTLAV